jgi:pyruvate/2-oxoglutarate/acetoin dehydrogenase E1 component
MSHALRAALHEEMSRDKNVLVVEEDLGKMGSPFGITLGLLDEFGPDRMVETPISESGFVGMAVGAAMRGLRPVVELMYIDWSPGTGNVVRRYGVRNPWAPGLPLAPLPVRRSYNGSWLPGSSPGP